MLKLGGENDNGKIFKHKNYFTGGTSKSITVVLSLLVSNYAIVKQQILI